MQNRSPYNEEHMCVIVSITKATRDEVIKTLKLAQITLEELVQCLKNKKSQWKQVMINSDHAN